MRKQGGQKYKLRSEVMPRRIQGESSQRYIISLSLQNITFLNIVNLTNLLFVNSIEKNSAGIPLINSTILHMYRFGIM